MIVFENPGEIDLRTITTFGVCDKINPDPIGIFGTGLKYAIAVLLREGIQVDLYKGTRHFTFSTIRQKLRNTEADWVCMEELDDPTHTQHMTLAFTTQLGRNWKLWMAFRELATNCMDEGGKYRRDMESETVAPKTGVTQFVLRGDKIDNMYQQKDQIFLSTTPRYKFEDVEFHDAPDTSSWLYYRGIRVLELQKPAMFNYNLTCTTQLTEDRTLSGSYQAHIAIAKAVAKCDDAGLIRQMLTADQRHYESTIDYNWSWSITPGETFHKVIERYRHMGTSFNTSAGELHSGYYPTEAEPDTVQLETLTLEERQVLRAALNFWKELGLEILRHQVHVAKLARKLKVKVWHNHIYINHNTLVSADDAAAAIYRGYIQNKYRELDVDTTEMVINHLVEFGNRLLHAAEDFYEVVEAADKL